MQNTVTSAGGSSETASATIATNSNDMDFTQLPQLAKSVGETGMGVVAFCALLYGGWRLLQWLEEVKSNHLPHIQAALDKQTEHLASHGEKLDTIIQQTKRQ